MAIKKETVRSPESILWGFECSFNWLLPLIQVFQVPEVG